MASHGPPATSAGPLAVDVMELTSHDVDHARHVLSQFYYPISVGVPDGADGFRLAMEMIQLGPVAVGTFEFGGTVTLGGSDLDAYHVTMPIRGRVRARHAGHDVVAEPFVGAMFGPSGTIRSEHQSHAAEIDIKLGQSALEAELATLLGRPVTGALDLPPLIDLANGPGRSWHRLVRLAHRELRQPHNLLLQPLIARRMQHLLMTGFLLSFPHRYREELATPGQPGPPRALRRALDAMHDEPERPFTVTDLAAVAGMSVRSLQEGFRRHVGCAPMTYLQQIRLDRVHAELGAADPEHVTVAAVAHRWGFAHLGRFAAAYRERFGLSPSARLRGSS